MKNRKTKYFKIKEQTIDDSKVTGLTLRFEKRTCGEFEIYICGDNLKFGNRTLVFDADGDFAGAGTYLGQDSCPSWVKSIV